jgi:hypothetical protein
MRDIEHKVDARTMQARADDRERGCDTTCTMEIMVCTRRWARRCDRGVWSKMPDSTTRHQERVVQPMAWSRKARCGCAKRNELLNLCSANGASRGTRGNSTAPHIDCHHRQSSIGAQLEKVKDDVRRSLGVVGHMSGGLIKSAEQRRWRRADHFHHQNRLPRRQTSDQRRRRNIIVAPHRHVSQTSRRRQPSSTDVHLGHNTASVGPHLPNDLYSCNGVRVVWARNEKHVVADEHESKSIEVVGMNAIERVAVLRHGANVHGCHCDFVTICLELCIFQRNLKSSHNSVKVFPSAELKLFLRHNCVKGLKRQQKTIQSKRSNDCVEKNNQEIMLTSAGSGVEARAACWTLDTAFSTLGVTLARFDDCVFPYERPFLISLTDVVIV